MSDTDNQDYYEGGSADAPLIDSLGSAVKRLLDKGKARGYITVEELNKALPSERESSEQIEDIMAEISDMGISIISESDVDSFEQENDEEEVYDDDEEIQSDGLCKLLQEKGLEKDLAALWELEMFRQQNPYINKIREEIDTKIIEVQIKQLDNEIKECLRIIQVSESFPEEAYQRYESLKKEKESLLNTQNAF